MDHVHGRQLGQADDASLPDSGPSRNPHLGLELTQRHDVQRAGQHRRVGHHPAKGSVGLPLADQRESGIQHLQPSDVNASRGGHRLQPGGGIRRELLRQQRGKYEPQPHSFHARRLPAAAYPCSIRYSAVRDSSSSTLPASVSRRPSRRRSSNGVPTISSSTADLLAQRRLRNVHPLRCLRERASIGDCHQVPQMPQLDSLMCVGRYWTAGSQAQRLGSLRLTRIP